ncbi:MAG: GtrA family protein [Spirochaetales bacterium]|nr:GtrA family protein [Spirochaetales bacterium]
MNKREAFAASFREMFRFGLVGISNTLVTLSIIFILTKLFAVSYVTANAIGYAAGLINSFLLNRNWTFRSRGHVGKQSFRFLFVFLICYGFQLALLIILREILSINPDPAQLVAMIFYTLLNYVLNKLFTFGKADRP